METVTVVRAALLITTLLVSVLTSCSPFAHDYINWISYGGEPGNSRYSPLSHIDETNVGDLEIAWRWVSLDEEILRTESGRRTFLFEATPLMIDGVLYTSTGLS